MGVAGMLFLPIALIGAIRLAKPGSFWARRRYPEGSAKRIKSERRYARHTRRYQGFQDKVAGAPTPKSEA
jgi:lysyl-tRNA synthetase class 2